MNLTFNSTIFKSNWQKETEMAKTIFNSYHSVPGVTKPQSVHKDTYEPSRPASPSNLSRDEQLKIYKEFMETLSNKTKGDN